MWFSSSVSVLCSCVDGYMIEFHSGYIFLLFNARVNVTEVIIILAIIIIIINFIFI
jgi:hypothetical protein